MSTQLNSAQNGQTGLKTVVVFQGGGALGAFGAGAWQVLAQDGGCRGNALVAVAGASIGAFNAAVVAQHHASDDGGADTLQRLWIERIATRAWPFLGVLPWPVVPSHANTAQWNGFISGVLLGSGGLSSAAWPSWQPLSGLGRLVQPLHDRRPMWQLLQSECATYSSSSEQQLQGPMLAVAAVDVMAGALQLFDSDSTAVEAQHLAASSAIPLLYDPVEIDGRLYWDGEITRDSMLPALLQRLLDSGRVQAGEPLRLVTIEQFPRALAARPESGAEISYRAINLLQLDKLRPPVMDGIHIAQWCRLERAPLPEDGVSGQFDYTPARIDSLLQQGRQAARLALGLDAAADDASDVDAPDANASADAAQQPLKSQAAA